MEKNLRKQLASPEYKEIEKRGRKGRGKRKRNRERGRGKKEKDKKGKEIEGKKTTLSLQSSRNRREDAKRQK